MFKISYQNKLKNVNKTLIKKVLLGFIVYFALSLCQQKQKVQFKI